MRNFKISYFLITLLAIICNTTEDIEIKLGDLKQQIYTADYYDADFNQDITINTNTDVTF